MARTTIDPTTGDLLAGGKRVFPLGLSDPPPQDGTTPDGRPAWAEIADAGIRYVRRYAVWTASGLVSQLEATRAELDAAEKHGLQAWVALAGLDRDLSRVSLLDEVVGTLKSHAGLGAWKGVDEPALGRVPPAGCVEVYRHLRGLDPDHPVVIIEAPRAAGPADGTTVPVTAAAVRPYASGCDVHGIDIYPVSVPPGLHAGGPPVNTDVSVVGDMTRIVARGTGSKAIWTTLQIAWSGVLPPHPLVFPDLQQARFMAYDAIIAGARGLFFFGGHIAQAMNAADRARGWNWTYWQQTLRPLLVELTDPAHEAALVAPLAAAPVEASAADIRASTRADGVHLYLIAVRSSPSERGRVRFSNLPAGITTGTVLAHPLGNPERPITVSRGAFTDPAPYAAHHARVYRFPLPA